MSLLLSLFPFLAENWQNVAVTVLLVAAIGTGEEAGHHHDTRQAKLVSKGEGAGQVLHFALMLK